MQLGTLILTFAGVAGVALGADYLVMKNTEQTVHATVTDKERVTSSSSDGSTTSKYLVYTDKEVFQNTDSMVAGKFNSSNVQGYLQKGCAYDLKVIGFRMPFFSAYQNIIDAVHTPTETCPTVANAGLKR